jgi:hypothetical protein
MAEAAIGMGCAQGFGAQVPVGEENVPVRQAILRDPLWVYPLAQDRSQEVLLGVGEVLLHVPEIKPVERDGGGQGF